MFEAMCRGMTLHQIRPVIDRVMPWTQAAHAIDELASGAHFGKIVLSFD
jgi:NADPH:quinone reductase-like Zn-dependent oxidoreductase